MSRNTKNRHYVAYIGANIAAIRAKHGWTQEHLAEKAGIEPQYLQKIEHARATMSLPALLNLADVLGVRPQVFFRVALNKRRPGRPRKKS